MLLGSLLVSGYSCQRSALVSRQLQYHAHAQELKDLAYHGRNGMEHEPPPVLAEELVPAHKPAHPARIDVVRPLQVQQDLAVIAVAAEHVFQWIGPGLEAFLTD